MAQRCPDATCLIFTNSETLHASPTFNNLLHVVARAAAGGSQNLVRDWLGFVKDVLSAALTEEDMLNQGPYGILHFAEADSEGQAAA